MRRRRVESANSCHRQTGIFSPKQRYCRGDRSGTASALGKFESLRDLPLNLRLARHQRVKSTGHFKEMSHSFFIAKEITMRLQFSQFNLASFAEDTQEIRSTSTDIWRDGIHFYAATSREQDILLHDRLCSPQYLWQQTPRADQPLSQRNRGSDVISADSNNMHESLKNLIITNILLEILGVFSWRVKGVGLDGKC